MYDPARPVQFVITDRLNKCEADALAQKEWVSSGHIYYGNTLNTIRDRVFQLRRMADMYEDIYHQLSTNSLSSSVTLEVDDLSDISIGSTALADKDITVSLSGFGLIDYYVKEKTAKHSEAIRSLHKLMKHTLGEGFTNLKELCTSQSVDVVSICANMLYYWFCDRCDWPYSHSANVPPYNLAAVPQSIDAIILAYSIAVVNSSSSSGVVDKASKFADRLSEWLHDQGEGHVRGQADAYKKEGYGLVPRYIFEYVDGDDVDKLYDDNISLDSLFFAAYLERIIKSKLYEVSTLNADLSLYDKYMNSIAHRIEKCRCIDTARLSTQELHDKNIEWLDNGDNVNE